MSRYLHGGGIPFIAEQSVDQIARNPVDPDKAFVREFVPVVNGRREGKAAIRLHYESGLLRSAKFPRKVDQGEDTFSVLDGGAPAPESGAKADVAVRCYYHFLPDTSAKDLPSEDSLKKLAKAMVTTQSGRPHFGIPAAYTYLGQFIAHDISEMKPDDYPLDPLNFRTHALGLDSLFGPLPSKASQSDSAIKTDGLFLGPTKSGDDATNNYLDLGRADGGFPCVADPRNDNNLSVAQLTVAMIRFHQRICALHPGISSKEQQAITIRHFQSVVLDDYLRRIIDPVVYHDVRYHGRKLLFAGKVPPDFRVPIEFAGAAFRFGHATVRDQYDWNDRVWPNPSSAATLRRFSHRFFIGGDNDTLDDVWVVDWDRFLARKAPHASDRFAGLIISKMGGDLTRLDPNWVDEKMIHRLSSSLPNLAEVTLIRGRDLALPSGEVLTRHFNSILPKELEIPELHDPLERVREGADDGWIGDLDGRTPLWFYVLREAEVLGQGGQHLGPLGSRIVMETIHCAIEVAEVSILSGEKFSVDHSIGSANPEILTLDELVTAAFA
jgi:hypothetical protein